MIASFPDLERLRGSIRLFRFRSCAAWTIARHPRPTRSGSGTHYVIFRDRAHGIRGNRGSSDGFETSEPALRADRGSAYVAIFAVSLALGSASLQASQLYDNDFYSARHTADGARLLAEVERFHMGPGREAMRVGRYPVASREFDFVLRAFPNHPQALLVMGELCSRWKSPVCATQLSLKLEKAVAINPSASGTFVALGAAQQRLGEPKKAIESYQRALELEPDSVNAEYDLALAYCDTKQYDLANEHAQRAYALGATLPGLRGRLVKAGKWKPLDLAQHPGAAHQVRGSRRRSSCQVAYEHRCAPLVRGVPDRFRWSTDEDALPTHRQGSIDVLTVDESDFPALEPEWNALTARMSPPAWCSWNTTGSPPLGNGGDAIASSRRCAADVTVGSWRRYRSLALAAAGPARPYGNFAS